MRAPLTVADVLSAQARLQPDRIAARDLERALTFRVWNARASRLANALLGLGLRKGDRVAVLAYNRLEWAEIYVAVAKAGLVAVPVNFRLTALETLTILEDSGASAIIVEHALAGTIEPVRRELPVRDDRFVLLGADGPAAGWRDYEAMIAAASETDPGDPARADDAWCLMYTSGTTGIPKGAIRSHRGMAMLAMMTEIELGLHRRDDALLVMPMCHANSLNFFTSFLYCGGGVAVFSRRSFDPALCLRVFGESRATFTSLTPTHYAMMLDVPEAERGTADFGRVEKLMISSAPARPDTNRAVMKMFPNSGLFELYGSTEAGWVTMLHPHEQFDRIGTVGREVVGSAPIRFLDEAGEEVPDGTPGELFSCGPYAFEGYWNNPGKTAEACRGDYVSVGDIGLRDGDGYIRLVDRKKNVIITGGENVYPSEVEAAIGAHPGVLDVAVVGQPDDRWGERVAAAVVRARGSTVTEEELLAFARERLAGYKRPRTILFLEAHEMPRNATGKILHRTLRERFAATAAAAS